MCRGRASTWRRNPRAGARRSTRATSSTATAYRVEHSCRSSATGCRCTRRRRCGAARRRTALAQANRREGRTRPGQPDLLADLQQSSTADRRVQPRDVERVAAAGGEGDGAAETEEDELIDAEFKHDWTVSKRTRREESAGGVTRPTRKQPRGVPEPSRAAAGDSAHWRTATSAPPPPVFAIRQTPQARGPRVEGASSRGAATPCCRDWFEAVDSVERALRTEPAGAPCAGLRSVIDQMDAILAAYGVRGSERRASRSPPSGHEAVEVSVSDGRADARVDVVRSGVRDRRGGSCVPRSCGVALRAP